MADIYHLMVQVVASVPLHRDLPVFWGFFVYVFFFLFSFFSELGTEPRALRLLGKRSTTELNPQPAAPPPHLLPVKAFSAHLF